MAEPPPAPAPTPSRAGPTGPTRTGQRGCAAQAGRGWQRASPSRDDNGFVREAGPSLGPRGLSTGRGRRLGVEAWTRLGPTQASGCRLPAHRQGAAQPCQPPAAPHRFRAGLGGGGTAWAAALSAGEEEAAAWTAAPRCPGRTCTCQGPGEPPARQRRHRLAAPFRAACVPPAREPGLHHVAPGLRPQAPACHAVRGVRTSRPSCVEGHLAAAGGLDTPPRAPTGGHAAGLRVGPPRGRLGPQVQERPPGGPAASLTESQPRAAGKCSPRGEEGPALNSDPLFQSSRRGGLHPHPARGGPEPTGRWARGRASITLGLQRPAARPAGTATRLGAPHPCLREHAPRGALSPQSHLAVRLLPRVPPAPLGRAEGQRRVRLSVPLAVVLASVGEGRRSQAWFTASPQVSLCRRDTAHGDMSPGCGPY